jgi:serine O-acetyltransferase
MTNLNNKNQETVSAQVPDWSREKKNFFEWNPSKSLLASIRQYQKANNQFVLIRLVVQKVALVKHRFWSAVSGAEVPITSKIDGGLLMPHPNGIVIHPDVKIGPNCLIFQQVTIGSVAGGGVPTVGGHVDIGAGAKVLGSVHLGNDAKIGANAVVRIDVPQGRTAVGIPAKLI